MRTACLSALLLFGVAANDGSGQLAHSLVGGWEVISGKYGLPDAPVELDRPHDPVQLKVFSPGHFAYVRNNTDGSFLAASAGSYVVDGDRYTETTRWSSVPTALGTRVTFVFRIDGDTLYMKGPVEARDAQGKKVEGVRQMEEVLRRAKTAAGRP